MDTGTSIDALVTSALLLMAVALGVSGAMLLVLGRTRDPGDAAATEFGASGMASTLVGVDDPVPAESPRLVVVPMSRGLGRERDIDQFLRAAEDAQDRVEAGLTPQRARMIEAATRVRERGEPGDEPRG